MSNIRNNNPFPVAIKKEEGVVDEDEDDTINNNNNNNNKRQRCDGGGNLTRGAGSVQVKREEEDNNNNNDTGGSTTTTTNPNPTISTTSSSGNNNDNDDNDNMMMTDEDKDNITNNNVVTTSTTTSITRTDIDTDTDNNDNNNEAVEQQPPPPPPPLASHITVKEWINVTDLLFSTSSKNYDVNMNVLDDYENTFINNIYISLENKFLCPMTNELKIIICNHVKGLIANKNNNNSNNNNNKRCRDDHHDDDDDDDGPPTKKAGGTSTATTTTTTTTTTTDDDDDSPSLPSPEVAQEPAIVPSIKIKRSSSRHRQTTDRLVDHGGTTTCYSNDYYCNNYNYNNGGKTKPSTSNNDNDAAAAAAATPTSNDDFFKMTVKELQSESRKRAIPYSGLRKVALVETLQSRMNSTAIGADPVSSPSVVVVGVAAGTIIADAATDADGVGRSINNKKLPPLSSSSSSSNNLRNARQGENKSSNNNNNNSRKKKKKKTKRSEAEQDDCSVLSTPYELSKLLCEIVNIKTTTSGGDDNGDDERHYHSREDSLRTLKKLYRWSYNEGNGKFLKYFHRYAGMYKLLDFMSIVLNDSNHKLIADDDNNNNNFNIDNYIGNVDMDNKILIDNMNCIKYVSGIIGCICCKGDWEDNRDIAIKLASTLLHDYNCDDDDNEDDDPNNNNDSGDGLEILLRLNQQFNPTLFNSYGNDNGDGDIAIEIDKNNNNNISSLELKSIQEIWNALRNMTSFDDTILLSEKQAVMVLDSGIQMIEKLTNITTTSCSTTSTAAHIADSSNNNNSSSNISIMISGILYQIFGAFKNIILDDLITKKDFRRLNVVSKCLQIFQQQRTATTMEKKKKKKKGSSSNKGVVDDAISWNICSGDEALTEVALDFLDGCRFRKLLSSSSSKSSSNDDYETILPVCVISLDEFGSTNYIIRNAVIELLEAAISSKVPTRKIELAGVKEFNKGIIQVLSHIRTSADIDVDEKGRLRKLIFKIMGE